MYDDILSLGRAPAIACYDLAGCFADRLAAGVDETRDDQVGQLAVQHDPPAVAIGRLHGDTTSEGAKLHMGLGGLRVVAFWLLTHGHAIPDGSLALPASRAPCHRLLFAIARARSPSAPSGYSEGRRSG